MKSLNTYINEKFQVSKDNIRKYNYHPKDKDELVRYIRDKIKKEGLGMKNIPLDLNDIDTSKITDMSFLFHVNCDLGLLSNSGYFDISDWDVSNVKNMEYMFNGSKFNGDISDWDVSKVENMKCMFDASNFNGENGDISDWDVSNVKNMDLAFYDSPLELNPPKWYHE